MAVEHSLPNKAMLLAAGYGTRLRPITDNLPKCMVPVAGKPVLEYAIERLRSFGVADLMINLSYKAEAVQRYFGDGAGWQVRITYSVEDRPLGTAGGVRRVADFFDGPFFVWYGDNLSSCDLGRLYAFHRARSGLATIALHHRQNPAASGIVGLDRNGRVTRFLEKPSQGQVFSHWCNAGIYVLEPALLPHIPRDGTPDFARDVFPRLIAHNAPLYGYRLNGGERLWWIDTLEDLRRVEEIAKGSLDSWS